MQFCQPLGRWIRGGCGLVSIVTSENEFCKNPTSKDTITAIYSESYGSIGGHKHSLDQGTVTWVKENRGYKPADIASRLESRKIANKDGSVGFGRKPAN